MDSIDSAGKLGQDTIACGVGDATAMLDDQSVHNLATGSECAKCPNLILPHQARVARYVSREDRSQSSLDPVLLRTHRTPGAISDEILKWTG